MTSIPVQTTKFLAKNIKFMGRQYAVAATRLGRSNNVLGRSTGIVRRHMSEDGGNDRIHSTDIAFKPAESGWGGGTKYSNHFDAIFGKKKKSENKNESETTMSSKDDNSQQ
mmetsp:Transcript_1279/g.1939  ORF Transcript_1279/g.1939 Transcript_1279/m.1939 type:complete len:111 (+) Transcript_1279:92-424(+)|eukprot:CAMPEP_0194200876 /NCGR_PEP_ID=MMETSP0156-20130528/1319_1 /TAXON_ID=33649 /ORGANISM="Thalassionema nitzschioides, Strain L26-B" /LENGTH=110 /DNA_ID=CAMNT_0038925943 /DNA_START=35 /DNA_END=367 /DNA_ORIENTATION=+